MDPAAAALPCVHLLLSATDAEESETLVPYAHAVCAALARRFGLTDVVVRSAEVPSDVLLAGAAAESRPMLFVVLGEQQSSTNTATTSVLETESAVPILSLKTGGSIGPDETALGIAKWCSLASPWLRERVKGVVFERRQARLVEDAQLRTRSPKYTNAIGNCLDQNNGGGGGGGGGGGVIITGDAVSVDGVEKLRGKVRDRFVGPHRLALLTTDRQSGFDRQLALVPFKGAVLNLTSAFWFDLTRSIVGNHLVAVPHPNVSIVKKCKPFPIEFVVRSYMTGSTSTSIWKNYQNGLRNYCGHVLPEGMIKNQKLANNLLTPTTKEEDHDRPISLPDIVSEEWMTQPDLDVCADAALKVFALGQQVASEHGLILVDTKYEFGRDEETGEILLIDEVHTPDSSRYWLASTYEERMAEGKEPDNIDKEFLRLWFADRCDPYQDEVLPEAPRDLVAELSRRYVTLYEMITWKDFDFGSVKGEDAIAEAIKSDI